MIEIHPYHSDWPIEFAQIAATVRQAMGDLALRIDHIGSTSVPGLAAKNIIDIQVTVNSLDESIETALGQIGYSLREGVTADHRPPDATGPNSDWEKRLFKPPNGHRPVNLHVRVVGRPNQRYALLFRDYLRAHPAAANAYAELKRRLGQQLSETGIYADVKDPACDLIAIAAEAWAAQIKWHSGLSDG